MADGEIIVLGLDPGSNVTGFGVVAEASGQVRLIETGTIRVKKGDGLAARLGMIHTRIAGLIAAHGPHEAAVENVFVSKNTMSALKLGQARGAALAACGAAGIPVADYAPTAVKKTIVGAGRAEKSQVAFMVAQILGLREPKWAVDASDALAVAVCHLNMRRFNRLAGAGG